MSLTPPTPPDPAESTDPAALLPALTIPAPTPGGPVDRADQHLPGDAVGVDHQGPAEPSASASDRADQLSAPVGSGSAAGVRQLSLFGVEAADPATGDLAGLLAGPGEVVRMGGTARVSIVVDAAWRVHVLVAELARRGLAASWVGRVEDRHGVRTAYSTRLAPLAANWLRGRTQRPPPGFFLTGPRLRLWTAAAGTPDPPGFLLRLGQADEGCWETVGAALAAIGLPAVLLDPGAGGPAYRITGRRRLARLTELVGDRPPAAPPGQWPAGPGEVRRAQQRDGG